MVLMKNSPVTRPCVLVLTSTFPRWENDPEPAFVYELSRRLTAQYNVIVLAPRAPGSKTMEVMSGLQVVRFPYFFRRFENLATHGGGIINRLHANPINYALVPFLLLGQLLGTIRLLRQEKFQLIHAHWLIPQGLIAVISLLLTRQSIPLVCTSHGGDLFALRSRLFHHLKSWVMERSQFLTVVSQVMKSMVVDMGISSDKVQVLPMGVDLKQRFTPDETITRNTGELLFVGRLVEKKGVRILLEAMPLVLAKHPVVNLIVVGSGPLEGELREITERLNISSRVEFIGMLPQNQLPQLYRRATLAVFPFVVAISGDQEGFGLVQVEAMGCGCPVIASDLPAIHDSITHEENGLLVPSGNPDALADAILRLLDDADWRLEFARQGRKNAVEKFDWEVIAEKYSKLYDDVIKSIRNL